MRPLRQLLGRPPRNHDAPVADSEIPQRSWNTLSTLQSGAVADVDDAGVIYPRIRPVAIEVWFGYGDRWIRGGSGDGLRQTRLDGLPVIETRQKLDDGDLVSTAWADESGGGSGRVVVELSNETNVSVVVAIVVRPTGLVAAGTMTTVRAVDSLIVVDKLPLVELGRVPGAVVTAIDDGADATAILDQLKLDEPTISGESELVSADGRASIAAIIPLTRGNVRQIEVLDGREEQTVAAAPLDTVQAGWKAHLRGAPDFELPGWPKHLPAALMSSLLGSTASIGRPLGDSRWQPADDSIRAVALARVGLDWASAHIADALLADVTEGHIERDRWAAMAAVCGAIAGSSEGREVLARHGDAVAAVAGHGLSKARTPNLVQPLLTAIAAAHGADAASDAASIRGIMANPEDGVVYARHGYGVAPESEAAVRAELERGAAKENGKPDAEFVGVAMAASAATSFEYEPLVPLRSLAGSTWRWGRAGAGDSPHARAALLIGLVSLSASESHDEDGSLVIDVFPGTSSRWLGQNMSVTNLPTTAGPLSIALRWHGERAAILWEFGSPNEDNEGQTLSVPSGFRLRCSRLDPAFASSERSGETLLEVPTALIAERGSASGGASSRSLL